MIIPVNTLALPNLQVQKVHKRINPEDLQALGRAQDSLKRISRHSWGDDIFDVRFQIGGIEASAQVRAPSTAVVKNECQKIIDDYGHILEIKHCGGK